mmetsp:Transcript_54875/g.95949  ORF Transcript_54875/g.95949 Transcript_54875/m.95949 type:complete len:208 (-) Transcript_54875:4634-5257(-)
MRLILMRLRLSPMPVVLIFFMPICTFSWIWMDSGMWEIYISLPVAASRIVVMSHGSLDGATPSSTLRHINTLSALEFHIWMLSLSMSANLPISTSKSKHILRCGRAENLYSQANKLAWRYCSKRLSCDNTNEISSCFFWLSIFFEALTLGASAEVGPVFNFTVPSVNADVATLVKCNIWEVIDLSTACTWVVGICASVESSRRIVAK